MRDREELEEFIEDWYWDESSHRFARELGEFLFRFIDSLYEKGLSSSTINKHSSNCWSIGKLVCDYGYWDTFSPGDIFSDEYASHEYEFKRKDSNSSYAINSYRSTWKKLYKYTKSIGIFSTSSGERIDNT